MSLHNWILNFEKITELPLPSSPTSVLPAPCLRRHAVRRRRHLAAHAPRPRSNRPHAHGLSRNPSALAFSPRDACPCQLSARHAANGRHRQRRRCVRPPPGRCAPARSPQFALLPLPAPIKGVGLPLHAWTARPRHSQLRRAQAHRGAPYSGHPRPESTPEMEPHRPPEALRRILSLIPSPEHERRRAEPPPAAPLRGPASSVHLPASQDHH